MQILKEFKVPADSVDKELSQVVKALSEFQKIHEAKKQAEIAPVALLKTGP